MGNKFYASPKRPYWFWGVTSLRSSEYRVYFLEVKRPGADVEHSALSGVWVKNKWSCTSTSPLSPVCLQTWRGQL